MRRRARVDPEIVGGFATAAHDLIRTLQPIVHYCIPHKDVTLTRIPRRGAHGFRACSDWRIAGWYADPLACPRFLGEAETRAKGKEKVREVATDQLSEP